MKTITIPLIGQPNPRGADVTAALAANQDQLFINHLFEKVTNSLTGQTFIASDKRPGIGAAFAASGAQTGKATINWVGATGTTYNNLHLFSASNGHSRLYYGNSSFTLIEDYTTTASTFLNSMIETIVNLVSTIMFTAADNKGYYTQQSAMTTGPTFTADTTNGSPTLANVSSTTGLLHGQTISGTGIPASTYLKIVGTAVTLMDSTGAAVNATATNATVTMTRSVIALIVSTAFPGNAGFTLAGKFTGMNGFVFIMDTLGNLWNSDLNSCVNWTATSFNNAGEVPDAGIGAVRKGNILCAFGSKSIEYFQNSGSSTGTILVKYGQPVEVGATSFVSILEYDETVYWCGRRGNDEIGVYVLDGFAAKKISPAFIDADITQRSTSIIRLARFNYGGHDILAVTTIGSNIERTWILQMDVGIWSLWQDSVNTLGHWGLVSRYAADGVDKLIHINANDANGYLTDIGTPVYTDAGVAVTRSVRTRNLDFGTNNGKILYKFKLVGAKKTSTYNIAVSFSDDDYVTTTSWGNIDMSSVLPQLTSGGLFHRRSFTISDANSGNCRLEAIEIPSDGMEICST